jgi:hypothetical protein
MISRKFKKLFNLNTDKDVLIEKRQSIVQQIVDLESELAIDGRCYSYSEIEQKMKGYQAIKAKHVYLDTLIELKSPPDLSPNFDEFIQYPNQRSHIND